ncbi:transcriptional regulator [Amycolatopsis sp. NPDC051061]|uniref:helix-turn-helix domain-containing protein n=1 Tax=Amycolatopsis sp. NPDC051061 TaxID=3155042 RepID=UPI00343AB91F
MLLAPARLFVVTLLAEMRWCEFGFICEALGVTPPALSTQLGKLRREGIVQTERSKAQRTWVRLTPEGCERLVNHLEALQAVVSRAAALVTTGAAACDGPPATPAEIPADVVRDLVEHYNAGETIESLVARHPYSYRKIRTALIDADVTLRPPRIPLPPTPPGMVNAYANGRSIRQLAVTYGMSYSQTRTILLAEGVELRRRGQP